MNKKDAEKIGRLIDWDSLSERDAADVRRLIGAPVQQAKGKPRGRGPSQLQIDLHDHIWIKGQTLGNNRIICEHNGRAFELAPNTTYTPDIFVYAYDSNIPQSFFIECKGPWEDGDSRVKFKLAAKLFPQYRWLWITREKGEWVAREATAEKKMGKKVTFPWL